MMPIRDLAELIAEGTEPYADTDAARVARAYLELEDAAPVAGCDPGKDGAYGASGEGNEPGTGAATSWRGAYPGMCRDPEICRGMTHCPRERSCCE